MSLKGPFCVVLVHPNSIYLYIRSPLPGHRPHMLPVSLRAARRGRAVRKSGASTTNLTLDTVTGMRLNSVIEVFLLS